jgi:multiple antibiotic resistance protein
MAGMPVRTLAMFRNAAVAFATFFATISPVDVAAMFASLTVGHTAAQRRTIATRGVLISTAILLICALFGDTLLSYLGISLAALRTAGGVLLLLIGIDMVFARESGGLSTTEDESKEAMSKPDISVFPLATPLIAGPGAMGASILLMADAGDSLALQVSVIAALLSVLALTFLSLLSAGYIHRFLGITAVHVITRVFGVLLSALAVQFIFDGVAESGLVKSLIGR